MGPFEQGVAGGTPVGEAVVSGIPDATAGLLGGIVVVKGLVVGIASEDVGVGGIRVRRS